MRPGQRAAGRGLGPPWLGRCVGGPSAPAPRLVQLTLLEVGHQLLQGRDVHPSHRLVALPAQALQDADRLICPAHGGDGQVRGVPPELVKDFGLRFILEGKTVHELRVDNNIIRNATLRLEKAIFCDTIELTVYSTYGAHSANVFEIRAYE